MYIILYIDIYNISYLLSTQVNDEAWDLTRPLQSDCTVSFLDFSHPLGQETLWHSGAHVLGQVNSTHHHVISSLF